MPEAKFFDNRGGKEEQSDSHETSAPPESPQDDPEKAITAITNSSETPKVTEPDGSITPFQTVIYGSFILTFCLAGFAALLVFRKALKTSVKRFTIAAKTLAFAYLFILFGGFFATYLYSQYLNGVSDSTPLVTSLLIWVLVGPAIAIALNSMLTREDKPSVKKLVFDGIFYLIIFGSVVASQAPELSANDAFIFSILGVIFFAFPLIRFSASVKVAKEYHPEMQEIFVQFLIRSLLFLPMLLPLLVSLATFGLASGELTLLLFNLITAIFVLMTSLLMIICIDYITQGISADQLVTQKPVTSPVMPKILAQPKVSNELSSENKKAKTSPTPQPDATAKKQTPAKTSTEQLISPADKTSSKETSRTFPPPVKSKGPAISLKTPSDLENSKVIQAKPATDTKVPTGSSAPGAEKKSPKSAASSPSTPVEPDFEETDSKVIEFNMPESITGEFNRNDSKTQSIPAAKKPAKGPENEGLKPLKVVKPTPLPKPPKAPDSDKSPDSDANRIKPPEKPKKRF